MPVWQRSARIGERVVVHRLFEVDGVENLDTVLVPHQDGPALLDDPPFRVSDDIRTMALQEIGLEPKPGLAAAGAADDQHILVPGGLGVLGAAVHGEALRPCQDDIVLEHGVHERLNVLWTAP